MNRQNGSETSEKLIRVRADRRGVPVELRVQYEVNRGQDCVSYRIVAVEETN